MLPDRIKILFIGFNVAHTGFTRVMHSIIAHLNPDFDIHYAALGLGPSHPTYDWGDNVTVHLYDQARGFDPLRNTMAKNFIREEKPDVIFMLNDLWFFKNYYNDFKDILDHARLVYYAPVDGILQKPEVLEHFDIVDEIVAYTQFGAEEVEKNLEDLISRKTMQKRPAVSCIAHGVDTHRFRSLGGAPGTAEWKQGKVEAKRKLWGDEMADEEAFVVLNANRVQFRKRIDLTIEAFANFAKDKPDNVRLCLHHAVMPFGEEQQVMEWVRQWGIEDRLLFSTVKDKDDYIDDEKLNLIYNACDVGVNTSMGEGWGLIAFEHGAAGSAQIVPGHSACGELWREAGLILEPVNPFTQPNHPMKFAEISANDLTMHFEQLYTDEHHLAEWSKRAYHHAQKSEFKWENIGSEWSELFMRQLKNA